MEYQKCDDIDTVGPTKKALEILARTKQIHKDRKTEQIVSQQR